MNYMNEPVFIQIMADWMAKEFPEIRYERDSAWWVVLMGPGKPRALIAWIGYDKAFGVGRNAADALIFDPHSPTFFEDCRVALQYRLQEMKDEIRRQA